MCIYLSICLSLSLYIYIYNPSLQHLFAYLKVSYTSKKKSILEHTDTILSAERERDRERDRDRETETETENKVSVFSLVILYK